MKIFSAFAAILLLAVAAMAQTTNGLSDAEIQGRRLAQQLLEQSPATNFTQTGVLKIKHAKTSETNFTIRCEGIVTPTNWSAAYILNYPTNEDILAIGSGATVFEVSHFQNQPNKYIFNDGACMGLELKGREAFISFGGSDFWLADLGLEFFHWPEQKILKKEKRRTRACNVLESTNPDPSKNGYSRVVSWIDEESGGIVYAEAYDANGKKLKEFEPKSFKKVNGQWELKDMEIRNVQTRSRTRIEFDLKKK